MEINCKSCKKNLSIPDEKIPPNKKVSISCPACKNKITIERQTDSENSEQVFTEATKPLKTDGQGKATIVTDPSQFADDDLEDLGILDETSIKALVCDTTHNDKILPKLKEMGYKIKTITSIGESIGRMKFTKYDLVVLSEDFAGSNETNNSVLQFIQQMQMPTRRKMFVALLGNNFHTLDNMKAFMLSVNVVINFKDIDNLAMILKKSILDNDAFYKVFKETLISSGKL